MTKYISIDTETTGLDSLNSDLLEVGFAIFDSEYLFEQNVNNTLRIVLIQDAIKGSVFAINMNQTLLKEILEITPQFDLPNAELVIEKQHNNTTIWYVDLRPKDILDKLYSYKNEDALNIVKYKLTEFLSNAKVNGKLNIAGKNFSGFDKLFLEKYNCFKSTILNKAHHRVLDVGSMYVNNIDENIPDLKECLKRAGQNIDVPHTAVEDAILVVKAAQYKFLNEN
jgi:oligoribonuclease (3'-5' exoribonuclease)